MLTGYFAPHLHVALHQEILSAKRVDALQLHNNGDKEAENKFHIHRPPEPIKHQPRLLELDTENNQVAKNGLLSSLQTLIQL